MALDPENKGRANVDEVTQQLLAIAGIVRMRATTIGGFAPTVGDKSLTEPQKRSAGFLRAAHY